MGSKRKNIKNEFKDRNKNRKKDRKKAFFSFRKDERFPRILGLIAITLSAFLLLSFTSFLFSWKIDQSLVDNLNWKVFQKANPQMADNWMGLLGAYVSHMFIYRWFGVASYWFVFLLFIWGYRELFQIALVPMRKTTFSGIFLLFWLSVFLGITFQSSLHFLGGGFGYRSQFWLSGVIGKTGTIILLLTTLTGFLILTFNLGPGQWLAKINRYINALRSAIEPGSPENAVAEERSGNQGTDGEPPQKTGEETMPGREDDPLTEDIQLKLKEEEKARSGKEEEAPGSSPDLEITTTPKESSASEEGEIKRSDYDPKLDLSNYEYPPLDLLNEYRETETKIDEQELSDRKDLIVNTLKNYTIEIDKIRATVGPTVTLYEIIPAAGVRISRIKNLEDDIALSLAALGIRIIAPIPGRGTIGIEVPNSHPEMVSIRSVLSDSSFRDSDLELPVALGKTISNEVYITDLTRMPHLLMAGATGQGKSVGLNTIIASLLYKKHPSQVKFVLVDPKKVELSLYRKIENHFLAKLPDNQEAIITDTEDVVNTFNSLCAEMEARYDLLKDAHVRNIAQYNKKFIQRKLNPEKGHRYLPYIVLIIDELADLMMTSGKEIETPVARLAQLARAIGIHLILATQRPSVNIITGVIKANFPARIAFRVTSKVDSRTILDAGGAEQLIGRGDLLLSAGSDPLRLQGAYIDTDEIERITDFISDQQAYSAAHELPEAPSQSSNGGSAESVLEDWDPMFEEAARIIVQHQQGSTSLLQRRLKLGYNRAGRIVDQLEAAGIIGPFEGSKPREVLIDDEYALEQFLTQLKDKNNNL